MVDKDKKIKDDKKTDRQKLKYGGSYARARLLQQLCSFFSKEFQLLNFIYNFIITVR